MFRMTTEVVKKRSWLPKTTLKSTWRLPFLPVQMMLCRSLSEVTVTDRGKSAANSLLHRKRSRERLTVHRGHRKLLFAHQAFVDVPGRRAAHRRLDDPACVDGRATVIAGLVKKKQTKKKRNYRAR
jgi:hypothetical protein